MYSLVRGVAAAAPKDYCADLKGVNTGTACLIQMSDPAYNPMNYQQFAVTNDGVIFFFSQGQLLPEAAGATQVLVPRSAIDPMLA
jgi:Protein of unknown function (DUF3298)